MAVKFLKGDLTQEFMREIHLLARLRNEYCVLCIGAVHSDNEVGVVTGRPTECVRVWAGARKPF